MDGSKVALVGMDISFKLGKQYRNIECQVICNLIYDFVLGWDFFSYYGAQEGYLSCEGERISVVEDSSSVGVAQACERKPTPRWKRDPVKAVKRCKTPDGEKGYTRVVERKDGSQHRRHVEQLKPVKADFLEVVETD